MMWRNFCTTPLNLLTCGCSAVNMQESPKTEIFKCEDAQGRMENLKKSHVWN
jgi:hypothetical protein